MSSHLTKRLQSILDDYSTLNRAAWELRQLKDEGIGKSEITKELEKLRVTVTTEEEENRILALLDLVVGFCAPHNRIWPDDDDYQNGDGRVTGAL